MNILPELLELIKEYTIGYRTTIEKKYIRTKNDTYDIKKEVWKGDQRFQTGIYKSWYSNGAIRSYDYWRTPGSIHNSKLWYFNGNLEFYMNKDGSCISWYENGNIEYVSKDEEFPKYTIEWHKNGNLRVEYVHVGYNIIIEREWYEDGRISFEKFFNNKKHRIHKFYYYGRFGNDLWIEIKEFDKDDELIYKKEKYIPICLENRDEYYTGIADSNKGVHDRVQGN